MQNRSKWRLFKLWFAGEGEQPVTWGTLEVLHDVELTTLASDTAEVKLL